MSNLSYERNYFNITYFFGKVNFMNYKSSLKILNKILEENVTDNQQQEQPQNNQQNGNQQQEQQVQQNNNNQQSQQNQQQNNQQNGNQKNGFNDEQQKAINACKTIFSNAKKNGNKLTNSDKQNLIANLQNLKKTLPR